METGLFLAIDIGASGGRHILGHVKDGKLILEEIYRFRNGMDEAGGTLHWDTKRLFDEITAGMRKCKELGRIPQSVGIDTWGVDFVLLDKDDHLIGKAVGYRDSRTDLMDEEVYKIIPEEELYRRTGIQKAIYNTIFQLMALKKKSPTELDAAETILMIPDYFHYLLSGQKVMEYSEASTTGLLNPVTRNWDYELLDRLGFPGKIFGEIKMPGSYIGNLTEEVKNLVGYDCKVIIPPSHDTASAVLAVPAEGENTCYISSGTWSLMGVEADSPDCSIKSKEANITNEGGYGGKITYLCNIMGLWMIQSVRNELAPDMDYGELCEMASKESIKSIVDCQDQSFLAPKDMAAAIRDYCRRTNQEIPDTLYKLAAVIYNSLAKCYADKLALIESVTGVKYEKINIIGGGSNASYLNELTAKATGRQVIAGPTEATAIGNMLSQMISEGVFNDVTSARECVRQSFEVKVYQEKSMALNELEIKKQICDIGKRIYGRNMVAANDGNISVKLNDHEFLCTPTGVSKGFMTPEYICKVDEFGNVIEANEGFKPSSEIKMHMRVYAKRPDVGSVVHAHPNFATSFAIAGKPLNEPIMPEAVISLGCVPLAPYGTPSTMEIPDSIEQYLDDFDCVLLENHGALTWSSDLNSAYMKMESLEFYAELLYKSTALGGAQQFTKEQIKSLVEIRERFGMKGGFPANRKGENCYKCDKCFWKQ